MLQDYSIIPSSTVVASVMASATAVMAAATVMVSLGVVVPFDVAVPLDALARSRRYASRHRPSRASSSSSSDALDVAIRVASAPLRCTF